MSTASEASGGGFWRGFFTGVFVLIVGTIALIVFFPMSESMPESMLAPTAEEPEGTSSSGSGGATTTQAPEDGAAMAPDPPPPKITAATEPQPSTIVQPEVPAALAATTESPPGAMAQPLAPTEIAVPAAPPAASDGAVVEPQPPVVASANNQPVMVATQDPAPQGSGPTQIAVNTVSEANVATGGAAAARALVEAPQAPADGGASDTPVIASARDPAPAKPVPESVGGNAAVVAAAPNVETEGGATPAAPAADVSASAIIPGTVDSEPDSGRSAARINNQSGSGFGTGIIVRSGSEIGQAAKTLVGSPALSGSPALAGVADATVPAVDEEIQTSMAAPVSEVPGVRDNTATVDTSTAERPRQRPEPPVAEGPAFEAFAAEFDDKNTKPLLAIILQDVGTDGLSRDSLISIDLPVTYAIAVDDADAPWSEALYREAGFEILAMVPDGGAAAITRGQPADQIAAQIAVYFDAVPGAIGFLDRVDGEIQRDTNLVKALIAALKPTGHALLVNKGSGFGSAVDLARLENIPSGSVVRVIDTERSPAAIRAQLDRAAFLAGQSGSAVVIGRTYPETVTTLVRWLLGGTARSVTVAPVSAVLKR